MTMLTAEIMAKRNRFGHSMTEHDLEVAKQKMELSDKVEDIKRNLPEPAPGEANIIYRHNNR